MIQFNEEQMRAVVTKAIVEGLGEEQKTLVIQQAIESLMKPAKSSGYPVDNRSVLQVAFDNAVGFALDRVARAELEKPEYVEKMRKLFQDVAAKVLDDDNEGRQLLRDAITSALTEGIRKTRY
jgi:uncharacterized protein (UPF0335 family)